MNAQPLNVKALGLAFATYLISSICLAIVLTIYWQMGLDITQYSQEQIAEMSRNSTFIASASAVIGATLAILCAYMVTFKTGRVGYKHAFYFGVILALYGVAGVFIHPEHHWIHQIAKLTMPFPLCLLGAWFAMLGAESKPTSEAQPNI